MTFLHTCPTEEQSGELKRYLEERTGPKACSSVYLAPGSRGFPSLPASHPLGQKLQAFHAAHWSELFMLPGPWGRNLSRVKDKPVVEPSLEVGSALSWVRTVLSP